MYTLLAMQWYSAEYANTKPVPFMTLGQDRRELIERRVRDVLEGEVPKSKCSPGDLAIWEGRYRVPPTPPVDPRWEAFKVAQRETRPVDRSIIDHMEPKTDEELDGLPRFPDERTHFVRERRWQNFWDSIDLFDFQKSGRAFRLFGNANIGMLSMTNLQVGGQLASDQSYCAQSWYANAVIPEGLHTAVAQAFQNTMVTFILGDKPQSQMPLLDLLLEPRPVMAMVPVRQSFYVEVATFGNEMGSLVKALARLDETMLVRIHFEGWQTRDVV